VKKFFIILNFFIWIIIKNYWCDIKSEKSGNILTLISSKKYKKKRKKKVHKQYCYVMLLDKQTQHSLHNGNGIYGQNM
jgi:uncharacterized protein YqjF (DUF2071 family)